jgi:hypothetical protein
MTETIAPPHANGAAPRMTAGDAQLFTPRSGGYRELFPSSWLRTPAKVTYSGGKLEGTLLEFCSTGLSILRPPSCDGHACGGYRDPGAGAGAALG